MESQQNAVKIKRTQKDYSLAFKLQVVDEVEKGYLTYKQAQRKYGIQGRATVLVWLRKHGRLNWQAEVNMKKKPVPNKQIKALEKRIKELELDKEILNKAIDVADEMFDTNIRKKYLAESYKIIKEEKQEKQQ